MSTGSTVSPGLPVLPVLPVLPASQVRVLTPAEAAALTPAEAAALTPEAAAAISPEAAAAISPEAAAKLEIDIIQALKPEAAAALSPEAVKALSPIAAALPSIAAAFSGDTMATAERVAASISQTAEDSLSRRLAGESALTSFPPPPATASQNIAKTDNILALILQVTLVMAEAAIKGREDAKKDMTVAAKAQADLQRARSIDIGTTANTTLALGILGAALAGAGAILTLPLGGTGLYAAGRSGFMAGSAANMVGAVLQKIAEHLTQKLEARNLMSQAEETMWRLSQEIAAGDLSQMSELLSVALEFLKDANNKLNTAV